mmetsp:Transcript_35624/g.40693  ORF Transcript_35624/g.40693 Transcript_35624/m.40693 type:complete len:158 (+) Transcript_35624:149-622(+)
MTTSYQLPRKPIVRTTEGAGNISPGVQNLSDFHDSVSSFTIKSMPSVPKGNNNNNNSNNDGGSVRTSKNHGYRWQSIAGYILSQWIGRQRYFPISYSEASWTGLLNACDCVDEESALQLLPTECRETIPRNTYTEFSNISMSMRVIMSTTKMMEYHP